MVARIVVTGADEVARRFGAFGRRADDLTTPFLTVANQIGADARALVPRVTGRLGAGIRASATRHGGGVTVAVPYAGPINYGWPRRGIAASLFLQRAADTKGERAAEQIADELQRQINSSGLG